MPTPNISIIIPAFNEEANIEPIFNRISQLLREENYEIIFIDDGGTDNTFINIQKLARAHPQVKGISFSRNFGHQAALKAGLDHAKGNCTISIDCDLEHPPEAISKMLAFWREGAEVVISRRENSLKTTPFKRYSSQAFYFLLKLISDVQVEPGTADFRLLDKKVVQACSAITENELFWRGIIPWLGFKTKTLWYHQDQRQHGESKYTLFKMMKLSLSGITSFSTRPLYLSLYLGAFFAGSSFIYLLYAVAVKFFTDDSVSGWASVIASVLLIGGMQLLILGVMGIYLGKLFMQSKGRPQYVIRDTLPTGLEKQELKRVG